MSSYKGKEIAFFFLLDEVISFEQELMSLHMNLQGKTSHSLYAPVKYQEGTDCAIDYEFFADAIKQRSGSFKKRFEEFRYYKATVIFNKAIGVRNR